MSLLGGDALAWACVTGALAATAGAWAAGRRGRFVAAALLLVLAGVALRANLAEHRWLSDWDERYHAVVARNAVDDPFRPSVVPRPFKEQRLDNWGRAEVWLHKPPLATWLMAASLATFGESERAVRIPSVVLAGLAVFLTFLIGRRLLGAAVGLLAAAIHAWHGRLAQLAAGLRATDHVDHQMIVLVELGVWLALCASDALVRRPRGPRGWALAGACGLVLGLALLTKSLPALVIAGVLGVALFAGGAPWAVRIAAPAGVAALGWLVQLPWQLYTEHAFPVWAAHAAARNARYFTEVVAGQTGPPWFYLTDMMDLFGWLAPVAVALFLAHAARRRPLWAPSAWLVAPYLVFSLSQTKMSGYVLIAAPVVMLAMAWVGVEAWSRRPAGRARVAWRALAVLLLGGFLAESVVRVHRPWRHPERRMLWAEELRFLGERVAGLGPGPWVVFDVASDEEARFYTRATIVEEAPTADDLARARDLGFRIAVYGEDAPLPASAGADVVRVPHDPRTAEHRAVLRQLPQPPEGAEVWLWNARDAFGLEEYLERHVRTDARARVPDAADLARAERARGVVAVLVRPGDPSPALPDGHAWERVESERFARPLPRSP